MEVVVAVIYRITNMANGHYYIGSAESFARREWQHKYDLKRGVHKNPRLQAAWNAYGEDMFVFEAIEEVPPDRTAFDIENTYLIQCVGKPDCYNVNVDAYVPRLGIPHTEASKAKVSASRKGKAAGENHYRYGKQVSPEVRAKISATQKGRPNPRKGLPMSEQGRANVAAAVKRGEESHFYGKRPSNADDLQKTVYALKPDGTTAEFSSLSYMRGTLGVSLGTIIRACKSGKPVSVGVMSGWILSYEPVQAPVIPEEYASMPRTRQLAKEQGVTRYFTGQPCNRGHLSPRSIKGACLECACEDERRKRVAKPIPPC